MRALVKEGPGVRLIEIPAPALRRPDDVIVRVIVAGICRTDLHVAAGTIPSADPITLGHEFCGRVIECGDAVTRVAIGDLVTADPVIEGGFLGVTHHGAFADQLLLPEANVYRLPPQLDPRVGAYTEPVAAVLAVCSTHERRGRGLVYGDSRFSRLVVQVLRRENCEVVATTAPALPGTFDFAVETSGTDHELALLIEALRPHGTLILKSRNPSLTGISIRHLVDKEITLQAVRYGSFELAIAMLHGGELDVSEMLGATWPVERFGDALAAATQSESHKLFLSLEDPCAA